MSLKGRPRSEEKRLQILGAAMELFMEQRYEGTSMDMVAERAGVSKQTVYSHFNSKEDLFAAAVGQKCIVSQLSADFLDDERPCRDMLFELGKRFHALLMSQEVIQVYRLCVGGAEQHPELSRLFFAFGPDRVIILFSDYLERQNAKGRLAVTDPRQAACQFLFMVKAEAHLRAVLNVEAVADTTDETAYIKSCVDVFLCAYGR